MNTRKLPPLGVAPVMVAWTAPFAAIAAGATILLPQYTIVTRLPFPAALAFGGAWCLIGLILYAKTVHPLLAALKTTRLATTGGYALSRHPLYAAWIEFIIPGLAILFRAWPILLISVVLYAVCKKLVVKEERLCEELFGEEYRKYSATVPRILLNPFSPSTIRGTPPSMTTKDRSGF